MNSPVSNIFNIRFNGQVAGLLSLKRFYSPKIAPSNHLNTAFMSSSLHSSTSFYNSLESIDFSFSIFTVLMIGPMLNLYDKLPKVARSLSPETTRLK
jgi:hypothetical protein